MAIADVNSLNDIGTVFFQMMGFGEATMFGIMMLMIITIGLIMMGMPATIMLPVIMLSSIVIYIMTSSPVFLIIFAITIIVTAVGLINGIRRQAE